MNLLHDPPSGFDGVAKAFAMARQLPPRAGAAPLQVGLVFEGALLARGALDPYTQLPLFGEHLRGLGWREHLLGEDDEVFGCDLLFSLEPALAHADDDPSFIRRTPIQLWGDQHAGEQH